MLQRARFRLAYPRCSLIVQGILLRTSLDRSTIVRLVTRAPFPDTTVANDKRAHVHLSTYGKLVTPRRTEQDRIRLGSVLFLQCEASYLELFKDMKEDESFWLDGILSSDGNYVLAERSCGIPGTLATIERSRGDLLHAQQTVEVYTKVLKVYQGMCDRCTVQEQKDCCEVLTYKHDCVVSKTYQ
jgi:hypothetical protein